MEFKGTKGKWKYYKKHDGSDSFIVGTKTGLGLFFSGHHSNTFERHANALLISKAPEMLEMLKELLDSNRQLWGECESRADQIDEVEQLIKQATEL